MQRALSLTLFILVSAGSIFSQGLAHKRAESMKLGVNVSYLEHWWAGTKEKRFSDFAKPEEVAKREKMFADIAKAGFTTVRIPINFGAWMQLNRPYDWDKPEALKYADSFVEWGLKNNLKVIIDLHHIEYDGSVPGSDNPERIINLWLRIAERYKDTDPENVFFELRNEPHDIKPEVWRWQAEEIIKVVRPIAPKHTLIVGFHDWNSRQAMIDSKPFKDDNIIYTFHYYDPFLFTHQGATWSAKGLADVVGVPFPYSSKVKIKTPDSAKGEWVANIIQTYAADSDPKKMYNDLKAARDWADKNKVPIFLGEFGSYNKNPTHEDRCRHAEVVYSALGKLGIPATWWEWDGGFNMFKPGTTELSDCMKKAIGSYYAPR